MLSRRQDEETEKFGRVQRKCLDLEVHGVDKRYSWECD